MIPPAVIQYVKDLCARHLVDDDPTQFERFSADTLIDIYLRHEGIRSLVMREALSRLTQEISLEDRIVLSAFVQRHSR